MSAAPPHLLHVFSTFAPAGPELRTVRLIEALGASFWHSILAIDGRTDARRALSAGAPARILEAPPRAGTPRTVRALRRILRAERPALVLTYNWGAFDAVLAARSLGLPVLHHEDGFNPDELAGFKRRRELARALVLRGVERVIVPSERLLGIATRRWRLPRRRLLLIPNGIRAERFSPADGAPELRASSGIPREALVAGFVGHLRAEKNPARVLAAVRALPGVHALLLGEGPERARLEELASTPELAGRVHLAGHRADPAPWYRAMDVFVIGSDTEQMPVALLEAMASSLPVVATDVGDVARMLPESQRPFVVPLAPGDPAQGLARALHALAASPEQRALLGAANRARVLERYRFEDMLAAYRALYEQSLRA